MLTDAMFDYLKQTWRRIKQALPVNDSSAARLQAVCRRPGLELIAVRRDVVFRYPLLAVVLLLASGCTTTIVAPAAPAQPVSVFLLDHGSTPSLVLPKPAGGMVRYAYGDWNWYALGNTGVVDGARALLWPTPGTLGRQSIPGTPSEALVRERFSGGYAELFSITVGRAEVERLLARLDAKHSAGAQIARVEAMGLTFVPHPLPYTALRNSNHTVAGWLRELGCETHGLALHSRWRVEARPPGEIK